MTTTQIEQMSKFGNWFAARIEKYEAIVLLLLIIVFIIQKYTEAPVGIIEVLLFMLLATAYFFSAFAMNENIQESMDLFINKLAMWGCSIGVIGILFKLSAWEGSDLMIRVGCITILIVLFFVFQRKFKNPELTLYNSRYIIRIIVISCLGLLLTFTPNDVLVKNHLVPAPKTEKQEISNPV